MSSGRAGYLNRDLIGELYKTHARNLIVYANSILLNADDAQEVVQEFFCSMYEKAPSIRISGSSIRSYLFVSVRNRSFNSLKTRSRNFPLHDEPTGCDEYRAIDDQMAIDAVFEYVQREFSSELREVFNLRVVHCLVWQEIAEITGVSLATVYRRFEEAVSRIREKFPDVLW